MSESNGGPAFTTAYWDEKPYAMQDGMTLRDYFAASYMVAGTPAWSTPDDRREAYLRWAECCYEMADAMIKAREAR